MATEYTFRDRLTRQQLAQFLKNTEIIRAFENLSIDVGETLPANEAEIRRIAQLALALAAQALTQADRAEPEERLIVPGPRGIPGVDGVSRFVLESADPEEPWPLRGTGPAIPVTGSRGGNAALASLLAALAEQGLIIDSTTA